MSAPRWRLSLIAVWLIVALVAFVMLGSISLRGISLLVVLGLIPPVMLVWLWNDDGPMMIGPAGRPR
jgi:hypothetical protein